MVGPGGALVPRANIANDPTTHRQFKVNGGQQDGTDVLIDGVRIEYASPNVQQNFGVSMEAVSEFKVLTGNFPADYGRTSGDLVDLVMKSGTNQSHGAAAEIRCELGKLHLETNRIGGARAGLERSIQVDPHNAKSFVYLSRIYARLGDSERAHRLADRARQFKQDEREESVKSQESRLRSFQPLQLH